MIPYLDPYGFLSCIAENFGYILPCFIVFGICGSILGFVITYFDDEEKNGV